MTRKLSNNEFLQRLTSLYGNKYDLSKVNYTGMNDKITLICDVHGDFSRMAQKELIGAGCPRCNMSRIGQNRDYNRLKTTLEFINQAKEKHSGLYEYSLVEYINCDTKIKIICKLHGVFEQLPWGHLKWGCKQCGVHSSRIEKEWIVSLLKPDIETQYRIPNTKYIVDGFDLKTNTVYEFYGDYWHGNPNKFKSIDVNTRTPGCKTFGQLYKDTFIREKEIKSLGYNIISIWESEFRKNLIKEK